jgi:hypothetical protein
MHQWHHADEKSVFYSNYSTKFAVWDWLFGTAYLPGRKKPRVFGLPYAYPKDYFLQHWFSVKRFDEDKIVEKYPVFRAYHTSRLRLSKWLFGGMGWARKLGLAGPVKEEGGPVGASGPMGGPGRTAAGGGPRADALPETVTQGTESAI